MIKNIRVLDQQEDIIRNKFRLEGVYTDLDKLSFYTYMGGCLQVTLALTITNYLTKNLFFGKSSANIGEIHELLDDFLNDEDYMSLHVGLDMLQLKHVEELWPWLRSYGLIHFDDPSEWYYIPHISNVTFFNNIGHEHLVNVIEEQHYISAADTMRAVTV